MGKRTLNDLRIGDIVYALGHRELFVSKREYHGVQMTAKERLTVNISLEDKIYLNVQELTSWLIKDDYKTYYFNKIDAYKESQKRLLNKNKTFKDRKIKLNEDVKIHLGYIADCEKTIMSIELNDEDNE